MFNSNLFKLALIVAIFVFSFSFLQIEKETFARSQTAIPSVIQAYLSNMTLAKSDSYKNMTIYPVKNIRVGTSSFILLDEAIKQGIIEITEKGSGDVNNLEVRKKSSKKPVFMMAGEIIQGAKQDRVIGQDIVLGTEAETYIIPVYCVEQGRWNHKTDKFDSAGILASKALRSTVVQNKPQAKVWSEVSKKNESLGASSGTSNYRASYESSTFKEEAANYISYYLDLPKEDISYTGVIIIIDGKISNIDLFSDHETFKTLWPKLLKSYAQDAIDPSFSRELPDLKSTENLIQTLKNSTFKEVANPGLGIEYSLNGENIAGNSLIYNNTLTHLAAFSEIKSPEAKNNDARIQQIPNIIRPQRQR
jgi:hypothetical protein